MSFDPQNSPRKRSRKRDWNKDQSDKGFSDRLKVPPQNIEAEKGVLGSIMLLNEAVDDVSEVIRADHFYSDAHQKIFAAVRSLYDNNVRAIDSVTLANELERKDELEEIGGVAYLAEILEAVPHAAHAKYYANIVREKWIQRQLISSCTEILAESYELQTDIDELLQGAERRIFSIVENEDASANIFIGDILLEAFDRIEERMSQEGDVSGLSSGFTDLDAHTTGFQPTELVILAARPSMGKTALVCNIAEGIARHENKGVLLFSLEQSNAELVERFLAITARVNGHDLRAGNLTREQRDQLMEASDELSRMPIYIDDKPGRTMGQVAALARRLHRKSGLGIIIIDYLQLIEPDDKSAPREQQIAGISRRLKFLAKELKVPVIALAQLNRGVELREDKRPRLADLRESGSIEQDADMVMFLHRPDAYDPEDRPGEAEVVIAKHRSGPTGIVKLTWRKEFMRFDDYSPMADTDFNL